MTRRRSDFKDTSKTGKVLSRLVWWVVLPAQAALIAAMLADPHLLSWWEVWIPLYILTVPFALIGFGVAMASRK